jgi:hypothetical protein
MTILLPVSWQLREALGFSAWRSSPELAEHPLVPLVRAGEFAGLFEGVPVLDTPHVNKDELWVVSLPAAATFVEWPSGNEAGVAVEMETFDHETASRFVEENPEVLGEMSRERGAHRVQESVLLTQRFCWHLERGDAAASSMLTVPPALIFES